jgi:hypothetical protein
MSDVQVISGTRRAMKEMADGTLRVQIDIDPKFRSAFFAAFGKIDMPVAIAPLVADFEKREPEPEDHGKHYAVLYKSGWFHNPRVVAAFGIGMDIEPDERIESIKEHIYADLGVKSLTEIPPHQFVAYLPAPIRSTLPAAFGAA